MQEERSSPLASQYEKKTKFDSRWETELKKYSDNYILYLTKKVRDNNDDLELREKIKENNNELIDIIQEAKNEYEVLSKKIKEKQNIISNQDKNCDNNKNSLKQNESDSKVENITINKKVKNMTVLDESLKNLFNTLILILSIIIVVNIVLIILSVKRNFFIY